jgi:hypothetical protein
MIAREDLDRLTSYALICRDQRTSSVRLLRRRSVPLVLDMDDPQVVTVPVAFPATVLTDSQVGGIGELIRCHERQYIVVVAVHDVARSRVKRDGAEVADWRSRVHGPGLTQN